MGTHKKLKSQTWSEDGTRETWA